MLSSLKNILPDERILINEPMKNHTSFKAGGPVSFLVLPETVDEIREIVRAAKEKGFPFMVIGNGSNLLVKDEGAELLMIKLGSNFSDFIIDGDRITANSGISLLRLSAEAMQASLSGMENISGIPGTLGGAVFMNAGAYESEIKDIIESATYIDEEGEIKTASLKELDLSYRHSMFTDRNCAIISATLKLSPKNREEIKAHMDEVGKKRRDKQPLEYPSAGSTFKRPKGYFAGKLIQDSGLAGFSVNGAQVSEKHCGFIINKDNATATDILNLMDAVTKKVYENYGVTLEPEVKII